MSYYAGNSDASNDTVIVENVEAFLLEDVGQNQANIQIRDKVAEAESIEDTRIKELSRGKSNSDEEVKDKEVEQATVDDANARPVNEIVEIKDSTDDEVIEEGAPDVIEGDDDVFYENDVAAQEECQSEDLFGEWYLNWSKKLRLKTFLSLEDDEEFQCAQRTPKRKRSESLENHVSDDSQSSVAKKKAEEAGKRNCFDKTDKFLLQLFFFRFEGCGAKATAIVGTADKRGTFAGQEQLLNSSENCEIAEWWTSVRFRRTISTE